MNNSYTQHNWFGSAIRGWFACAFVLLSAMWNTGSLASADDPLYMDAVNAQASGDYELAHELYRRYLAENPDSPLTTQVNTRVSVIGDGLRQGVDESLLLYLDALDYRDDRNVVEANQILEDLIARYPDSHLMDDALYLGGYIALMDTYDFSTAQLRMRQLQLDHPDSSYIDTAIYSEAIALEQLGNTEGAFLKFDELRERHTEFSLSLFGARWPKSTYLSRYWFDRSNNRLKILEDRKENAARLVSRSSSPQDSYYTMRVEVVVDGVELPLLLAPSSLTKSTAFSDEYERVLDSADTRLYSGKVENDPDSWARVMMRGNAVEGVVTTYGQRYELEPDTLVGTIDYYQAKSRHDKSSGIETLELQDYVMHPPPEPLARFRPSFGEPALGAATAGGVTRLVRMDIVVDSQYNDYYGGNGLIEAMSALNVADGIYRENFGMAIEIANAKVFNDRNADPMRLGAVTLEKTLRSFRDLRLADPDKSPDVGLTYLFSGNRNTDEAIGLAWIGAVCRTDGFDVGVTTPTTYGDLLVTHEIGHSMGAHHDTDTSCQSETNMLMWPRISSTTRQSFSACSTQSVTHGIDKSCLQEALDLSLDLETSQDGSFTASVTNNDSVRTADGASLVLDVATLDLALLPEGCVDASTGEIVCSTRSLQPGESHSFNFYLSETGSSDISLLARIEPNGFFDVVEHNNQARLDLDFTDDGTAVWSTVAEDTTSDTTGPIGNTVQNQEPASGGAAASGGGGGSFWLLASSLFSLGFRGAIRGPE